MMEKPGTPMPMMKTPRGEAAAAMEEEMMANPEAEGSGGELMIPASLFPKGTKEGDVLSVTGTVGKMGSKVAFSPTGAFAPNEQSAEEESTEL